MVQTPTTSIPYNGAGTINIHINNPTASVGGGMPQYVMPHPMYPCPYYCYPPNYYLGNLNQGGVNHTTNINAAGNQNGNNANATNTNDMNRFNSVSNSNVTTVQEKKKEREIVVLTDNYVKNLENYLRSNNVELRKNAISEVLKRFKEDKSRLENPSLTALLNLALQDKNSTVRSVAMTALEAGYAKGDANTEAILKNLQNNKGGLYSDAVQATDSLLQMSKTKKVVPDNSHYKDQPQEKKKGA